MKLENKTMTKYLLALSPWIFYYPCCHVTMVLSQTLNILGFLSNCPPVQESQKTRDESTKTTWRKQLHFDYVEIYFEK